MKNSYWFWLLIRITWSKARKLVHQLKESSNYRITDLATKKKNSFLCLESKRSSAQDTTFHFSPWILKIPQISLDSQGRIQTYRSFHILQAIHCTSISLDSVELAGGFRVHLNIPSSWLLMDSDCFPVPIMSVCYNQSEAQERASFAPRSQLLRSLFPRNAFVEKLKNGSRRIFRPL